VPGKFQSSSKKDLLFYNPLAGIFSFWTALEDGQLWADVPEGTSSTRKTWRHIVPGHFSESRNTDLVCYDELHQVLQFYQVAMGRTMPKLRACGPPISGVAQYWHTIIPGKFRPNAAYDDLLFYDPYRGVFTFRYVLGNGSLSPDDPAGTHSTAKTWTHIVPGHFSDNPLTDLLCYDSMNQVVQFYQVSNDGTAMPSLTLLGAPITGSPVTGTWHSVIPGKFSAGPYDDVFIYDAVNGQVSFRGHDGNSPLGRERATHTGCSPRWHQIIPVTFPNAQYPSIFTWELWAGQV